jgi:ATP-binding cassette subfamily G (WHITE) protein 2
LLETFSPEESLIFAAKLMTNLDRNQINKKVNDLIMRLGLENCRHTRIGSQLKGGISGGERKRASIGYELITDPQVILCDEPTSGLDSTTSLKIIKMLQ